MWAFKQDPITTNGEGWYVAGNSRGSCPYTYLSNVNNALVFDTVQAALAFLQRSGMTRGQDTAWAPNEPPMGSCIDPCLLLVEIEEVLPVPVAAVYRERRVIQ